MESWVEDNSDSYMAIIDFPGDVFNLNFDCNNAFEQQDLSWLDESLVGEDYWDNYGPQFDYAYYPSSVDTENQINIWFGNI